METIVPTVRSSTEATRSFWQLVGRGSTLSPYEAPDLTGCNKCKVNNVKVFSKIFQFYVLAIEGALLPSIDLPQGVVATLKLEPVGTVLSFLGCLFVEPFRRKLHLSVTQEASVGLLVTSKKTKHT